MAAAAWAAAVQDLDSVTAYDAGPVLANLEAVLAAASHELSVEEVCRRTRPPSARERVWSRVQRCCFFLAPRAQDVLVDRA